MAQQTVQDNSAGKGVRPQAVRPPVQIYPDATKRLPGNNSKDNYPVIHNSDQRQNVKIYKLVGSLFFYTITIVIFSLISLLTLLANHRGFQSGVKPVVFEVVGYTAATIPLICASVMFYSKKAPVVLVVLILLFFSYLSVAMVAFIMIIESFANFFTGIGLVCILHIGFMLWTRQEFNEVHEIRYY